jgi:hypothetical protein
MSDDIDARLAELSEKPIKELVQDYLDLKLDLEREGQKRLDSEREQERWRRRCETLIASITSARRRIGECSTVALAETIDAALRKARSSP